MITPTHNFSLKVRATPSSWRFVRHVARDPPLPVRLAAEHVEAGLLGLDRLGRAVAREPRGPDQAHDRHVARDDDLLDVERIDQRLRPVAKRTMQRAAYGIVIAFRRSAKIVAQVRREEAQMRVASRALKSSVHFAKASRMAF